MELSYREGWTVVHGLVLGTAFLLAFAGGLAGLWSLRPGFLTPRAIRERMRRLYIGGGRCLGHGDLGDLAGVPLVSSEAGGVRR